MKKEKIKTILIVLIILILSLNVGVYAAYVLSAADVNYKKSDGTTVSVKAVLDELYAAADGKILRDQVSVGDYVAYDATNNYSYTSPTGTGSSHGNGYGSQTFTSSSSIKWRVMGWDETTGGVVLISEAPIGSFTLKGAIGYLYAEQELNEICKIYGHGTGANTNKKFNYVTGDIIEGTTTGTITGSGARSINVDDINKICNVEPIGLNWDSYGKAPITSDKYYPTVKTESGKSTTTATRTPVKTRYVYLGSSYLTSTEEPYKMMFRNTSDTGYVSYYLNTRTLYINAQYWYYGPFVVVNDHVNYDWLLCTSYALTENEACYGIRPVVYLKSSIQTNGKNSSGAWTIIDK